MRISLSYLKRLLFRNQYCRNGKKAKKNKVNLEYYDAQTNLGDMLSPVIYQWMLEKRSINVDTKVKGTKHVMAVGSILGDGGFFDATVWGSGIKSFDQIATLGKRRFLRKLDIRAVRGPLTRDALRGCGYKCPEVFGDPAILMPLIYRPKQCHSEGTAVILHFHQQKQLPRNVKSIDIRTSDFVSFIDALCCCEKVISSSLHGIILAEAYGIPTVFLCEGRNEEILKYYDWYFSTGRRNVRMANTLTEAMDMEPMEVPDLSKMQEAIMSAFPADLWED